MSFVAAVDISVVGHDDSAVTELMQVVGVNDDHYALVRHNGVCMKMFEHIWDDWIGFRSGRAGIYVVSAASIDNINAAVAHIFGLNLKERESYTLLVVITHTDDPESVPMETIMSKISNNESYCLPDNVFWTTVDEKTGEGLKQGLNWLTQKLASRLFLSITDQSLFHKIK